MVAHESLIMMETMDHMGNVLVSMVADHHMGDGT